MEDSFTFKDNSCDWIGIIMSGPLRKRPRGVSVELCFLIYEGYSYSMKEFYRPKNSLDYTAYSCRKEMHDDAFPVK